MRWVIGLVAAVSLCGQTAGEWQKRGEDAFRAGKFAESVAAFDKVLALSPGYAPQHWQRGISLYYAGHFQDCKDQFALHRTVNPEDVENAVFHMLCAARVDGFEKARKNLIPISDDSRPAMMLVHAMFAGKSTPEEVLTAGRKSGPTALFYASLYVGYYLETAGKRAQSKTHFEEAVRLAGADYMGDTARVHLTAMRSGKLP